MLSLWGAGTQWEVSEPRSRMRRRLRVSSERKRTGCVFVCVCEVWGVGWQMCPSRPWRIILLHPSASLVGNISPNQNNTLECKMTLYSYKDKGQKGFSQHLSRSCPCLMHELIESKQGSIYQLVLLAHPSEVSWKMWSLQRVLVLPCHILPAGQAWNVPKGRHQPTTPSRLCSHHQGKIISRHNYMQSF